MAKQGIKDRKELADRAVGFLAANYAIASLDAAKHL
jgi:hypothetical protein